MSASNRCPSGPFGRHKFEARYDTERKLPNRSINTEGIDVKDIMDTKITYVHDICTLCGETRGRS